MTSDQQALLDEARRRFPIGSTVVDKDKDVATIKTHVYVPGDSDTSPGIRVYHNTVFYRDNEATVYLRYNTIWAPSESSFLNFFSQLNLISQF